MEDCCAVCAEPLEWIGYGPCGHREVCFACVARLRFILNDKNCCICKQHWETVFVTKALGEYTRIVTDWEPLQNYTYSCRKGELWYDSAVEAYFADEEPFKIIKAMCRLSCRICEVASEGESTAMTKGMAKKGYTFKNIGSLRRHQSIVHKAFMCKLCLESRKVFISEQKLYTKSQLDRHFRRGDPQIDHGNEDERGAFAGHPLCNFCRKPFYGENELYQHMSQEHFTCHMCRSARPGQFEYYRNYDDLEAHFRRQHVLCEDPQCLAKKFVVFLSDAELKRHNVTTHGGHVSRAQRNAALQIQTSFQYRRDGHDPSDDIRGGHSSRRGGRGQGGSATTSHETDDLLGAAILASLESVTLEDASRGPVDTASGGPDEFGGMDSEGAGEWPNLEGEGGSQDIRPSRYRAAVGGGGPSAPSGGGGGTAFPPLPAASPQSASRRQPKGRNETASIMAALLRGNGSGRTARAGVRVLNAARQGSNNRANNNPNELLVT